VTAYESSTIDVELVDNDEPNPDSQRRPSS
jgi:hypothetical protein